MSNLTPILTFRQNAEATASWAVQRLQLSGLRVERTFDLQTARKAHAGCSCPYHGTGECTCQLIVLLVHDRQAQPVTMIVHGHDGQTYLSLEGVNSQPMGERITQALLSASEIPET